MEGKWREKWFTGTGCKAWLPFQVQLVPQTVEFFSRGVVGADKQKIARPLSVFRWGCWLCISAVHSWDVLEGFCKCPVGWHWDGCFFKWLSSALVKIFLKADHFLTFCFLQLLLKRGKAEPGSCRTLSTRDKWFCVFLWQFYSEAIQYSELRRQHGTLI